MDSGPGFRKGDVGVIGIHERKTGGGLASPHPSGFLPPYRSTGHAFDRRNGEMRGRNDEWMPRMTNERLLERSIPDRSPGHAFIAIAHAGWRRHTKV